MTLGPGALVGCRSLKSLKSSFPETKSATLDDLSVVTANEYSPSTSAFTGTVEERLFGGGRTQTAQWLSIARFSLGVHNEWADAGRYSRTCLARLSYQTQGIFIFPVKMSWPQAGLKTISDWCPPNLLNAISSNYTHSDEHTCVADGGCTSHTFTHTHTFPLQKTSNATS